jgi:alcohol dehydrogenase class IV
MPVPPLIFIPTTAGSSSDVSQFCIILDPDERVKITIVSKAIVPDVSLIDPEATTSMNTYLTACTSVDALVHAIEAFVSTGSGVLTDSDAIEAIKLVNGYLPALIKDQGNTVLREKIMLGSMRAGLAFSNAILGAVHGMSHSLGGFLDLTHGECNAMLLEHVINYNFDYAPDKFKLISEAMQINTKGLNSLEIKNALISHVIDLKRQVGITNKLSEIGVKSSDIPVLTKKAVKDVCMLTNPRKVKERDIEVIYEESM